MKTNILSSGLVMAALGLSGAAATAASFIANPSFEDSYNPAFPHYGPLDGWTGGSGSNQSGGPFHNSGTPITDRGQVAFIQGSASLSQSVSGLTAGGTYWIQFFYDARACCGGVIDLATQWDGTALDTINGVTVSTGGAGYKFRNVLFTPAAESGILSFATLAAGDATALLDGVCIVQRAAGQIVVMNPGFEASGTPPSPGVVAAAAGWTGAGTGSAGINDAAGPFADNGTIPEQDRAGFLQNDMTVSQTIRGLVTGEKYDVGFRYNARSGNAPQLVINVDGTEIFNQAVIPVGGVADYRTGTASFTAAAATATLNFAQTAAGDQTVLIDDIRVSGVVVEPVPNLRVAPSVVEPGPGLRSTVSFTVSAKRLESGASTVTARIVNEAVARFVDADAGGLVTFTFPANSPDTTLTTEIEGVGRGTTVVVIEDNGGHDDVDGSIRIEGVTSLVRNASFETTGPNPGIGAGAILAWDNVPANSGINNSAMPFWDNGLAPDRGQVAYLQGSQTLSQPVSGLIPGQRYWVQAYYNARNCCGGTMDFQVRFGGNELAAITGVTAAGAGLPFSFVNASFTAAASGGLLEFTTTATGDATLLLDGISIVPHAEGEIVVNNPSFEASGSPTGVGYLTNLAGWTPAGGHGINVDTVGPFSDNGLAGAQDRIGFLQGIASFSQVIEGLSAGGAYTLTYLVNARSGDSPGPAPYRVLIDGLEVLAESQDAVGPGNPYAAKSIAFTAASTTAELRFEGTATDDQTLLLDDVHVLAGSGPGSTVPLYITPLAGNSVDIAWPASAPANLVLQTSTTMATDSWSPVGTLPFVADGLNHVQEVIDVSKRFYRLARP